MFEQASHCFVENELAIVERNVTKSLFVFMSAKNHSDLSSEELVAGILNSEKGCEEELARRFSHGLVRMLRTRTRDLSLAEDLAQDTFFKILERLRTRGIDQPQHLDRFVSQTAKFVHLGWLRKLGNRNELTGIDVDQDSGVNVEQEQIRRERIELVRALIQSMNVARDRDLMFRYYVNDEPKTDICAALDISDQHFDRVIHRARKRFRELAKKESGSLGTSP